MLGLSMVSPILPSYAQDFHVSYALVGLIISAFGIARIIMDLPVGKVSQKFNKKLIMLIGLVLVSFSSILAGVAPSYSILLLARFIEGAGSAIFITTASILLGQVVSGTRRGTLMSIYSGMLLLGTIFGPSFGGALATSYNIHAPFFAYAIVSAIGIIPTLVLPKESHAISPVHTSYTFSLRDIKDALSNNGFLLILPAIFCLFFIRTGVRSTLFPLFAANDLKLSADTIGILLTIAGITTALSMVPIGIISDRIGRRNPLILCLALSAVFSIGIAFATNFISLLVMIGAYGAAIGLSGPIAAYVTDIAPPDKISIYMGLYRMIGDIGFVVGPLFLGFIADITSVTSEGVELIGWIPFVTAAVIMIIADLFLFKAPDPIRKILKQGKESSTADFF
jgi:DHA1 family multidrug resistance protein-like MFS transporter